MRTEVYQVLPRVQLKRLLIALDLIAVMLCDGVV